MPSNDAERVIQCESLIALFGRSYGARCHRGTASLCPRIADLKFELASLKQEEATAIARLMAGGVGRAHGRQMHGSDRKAWSNELKNRHSKGLDDPRWLWSGVLDSAAIHEAAYLPPICTWEGVVNRRMD
jgi:uncharacterized protein (DUF2252 family)